MDKLEITSIITNHINNVLLSITNLPTQNLNSKGQDIVSSITNRLFLRRYRKYATTEDVKNFVINKLENIVNRELDIIFVPSFGGYKHWWTETYPACDWAEVINIKYVLEYLSPIMKTYTKGKVKICYESEEVILSELNNVPQKGLDIYTKTFRDILEFYNTLLDDSTLSLILAREQYQELGYTKEDLLNRINEVFSQYEEKFNAYDIEDQNRRIRKVETNFNLQGGLLDDSLDYTHYSKEEKYELYKKSRILNEAFLDIDYEFRGQQFFENESVIPLLFSFGLGPGGENWPHIGSCASSMVDFWAGMGIFVIEEKKDGYKVIERIISKSQYDLIKNKLIKIEVNTPLNKIHHNFSYAYVYLGELNF